MIYGLAGKLAYKRENAAVIEVGGVAFTVFISPRTAQSLPQVGETINLFTHLHVREDALELYGFQSFDEKQVFDKLTSVSGIGPKTALGVLNVAPLNQLVAAINEGKTELISKASGIGKKTAERTILELRGKLASIGDTAQTVSLMESDMELEDTLVSLGYTKVIARSAIAKLEPTVKGFKDRLRAALQQMKS